MAQYKNLYKVDLSGKSSPVMLQSMISEGNANANMVGAVVYDKGDPVQLNGSCTGRVLRADGNTVALVGTIDGNTAYVTLDSQCYAIPGTIVVIVNWVSGENVTTLVKVCGTVERTQSGGIIETETIPNLDELLAQIERMEEVTEAAEAAADHAEEVAESYAEELEGKLGIADYSAAAAVGLADNLIDRKSPGELNTWTGMRTACGDQSIDDDGNAEIVEMIGETAMDGSHVELTAIKTVGFNAYNNETGTAKLLGGHEYQITGAYTALTYSTGETIEPDGNGLFTPAADGVLTVTGGNATNTCVHLTWSGYRNGDYEPYWEQTKQIDLSEAFPYGVNGSVCYNQSGTKIGGQYESHDMLTATKAIRWINRVNIKDCDIVRGSNENCWVVQSGFDGQRIPGSNGSVSYIPGFQNSKGWSIVSYNSFIGSIRDKCICPRARTSRGCIFCDVDYATYWQNNDVEGLKAAMGDVYVYYLLTTPVETEFEEPLNLIYKVSDFGTEEVLNGNAPGSFNGKIRYSTNYVRAVANLQDRKITKPTNTEEQLAVLTLLGCTVDDQGIVHFGGEN